MVTSRVRVFLLALATLVCECIVLSAQTPPLQHFETSIAPLTGEDIDGACHYTLDLPTTNDSIRAVWILFARGRDIHDLAHDPDTLAFAQRFHVALLLQSHCPGKLPDDHGDMNMQPSAGLGPALLRALDHFAHDASRPELRRAPFILLGFSGTGPLSARLVNDNPQRTLAAILSAPGHFPPQGMDILSLSKQAQEVPELILAGGADDRSGTYLPYDYFLRHRKLGAPWTFALQNNAPHCCTANATPLMLAWLTAVLTQRLPRTPGAPLRRVSHTGNWLGFTQTADTAVRDSFGHTTFNATQVSIRPASAATQKSETAASWLPDAAVAKAWLDFVQQEHHPILPLQ